MILDYLALFSNKQAITASAASTNVLDLGATDSKVPVPNEKMAEGWIQAIVNAAFNNLDSLTVAVQTDDDEAFGTAVTLASQTALLADLVAGKTFRFKTTVGVKRYARLVYTVDGSNPSTGTITAGVTYDDPTNR